jgi:hypothetical protein
MASININKSLVVKLSIFILIGLFVFWFIGWESHRYDINDKEIGRNIIFNTPMVIQKDIPEYIAGQYIADEFGSLILTKISWEHFKDWTQNVPFTDIGCRESFTVKNTLYIENHGLLTSAFSSDIKYYVLSSSKFNDAVVRQGPFEEHSRDKTNNITNCLVNTKAYNKSSNLTHKSAVSFHYILHSRSS